jgi:hypothetical protein
MNNLTTSISFSIFSNKGVYALLLGSGISRPSGIPTGWDIVIDLIKKLAILKKEKDLSDPVKWFKEKYKDDPDYSTILSKLVATPSERVNLLKPYFEPSEQDRIHGLKLPTKAHLHIANLVKKGYIKLIITTNFDRLLENALQSVGIEPVVIRNPHDIEGTMPLVHNDFTLIKINGDYLDSRFLNTKDELAEYEIKMHDYLIQILNDFGIISTGWSAKWDIGLINIIRECQNFRFGSYWTYKDTCETELIEIASLRKGQIVKIDDADTFFYELAEKIEALETFNDNHPLTADIAVARLKKYVVKEENKILIHDLLLDEQESSFKKIKSIDNFTLYPDNEHIIPQLIRYESALEVLIPLVINGVYWGNHGHYRSFSNILLRFAEPVPYPKERYYPETMELHHYPSLLLLFSIGVSAVLSHKYDLLNTCFNQKIGASESQRSPEFNYVQIIHTHIIEVKRMNEILLTNNGSPLSHLIKLKIKPYFNGLITRESEFNDMFDVFEFLFALNYMDLRAEAKEMDWAPVGMFKQNSFSGYRRETFLINDFLKISEIEREQWLPIKLGMFDGDYERFLRAKTRLEKFLSSPY